MKDFRPVAVVTVTLNPAIDRTLAIPNFSAGAVNRVDHEYSRAGGKGVNVAATLADHGLSVAATGFLGQSNAAIFEQLFAEKNIPDHCVRIAGETRTGLKILDSVRHTTTDINFPGATPTPAQQEELFHKLTELASSGAKWFVLAGSLPPGVDASVYRRMITQLKEQQCRVLLDASGPALIAAIAAAPQIIKPNLHELEGLTGKTLRSEPEIIAAAREILAQGIELIAVSLGERGALFISADRVIAACPPKIKIGSTVGAGDAMVAGIIAAQLRDLPLEDCARVATAFSIDLLTRSPHDKADAARITKWASQVEVEMGN